MHDQMSIQTMIAFSITFITVIVCVFFAVFLARVEILKRIEDLRTTFKDFLVIAPKEPSGVKGSISAQLYGAMKDVCNAAKVCKAVEEKHDTVKARKSTLVSEVEQLWTERMDALRSYQDAVKRLEKVESGQ